MNCCKVICAKIPQRYVLCSMILFGLITCYIMRVCLQIALNEMTFKTEQKKSKNEEYCPPDPSEKKSNKTNSRAEFKWSQSLQHSMIMSAYVGYVVAHVPAGVLADTFGGKQVFGAGILISSVCSLLAPLLIRLSPYAFMIGRVVLGFGQGVMFPCSSALVAKWAPPNERSTITGIVQTGVMFGNAIGYVFSGLVMDAFPGWEPVFYFSGALGLIWCALWYPMCYSSPADHPFVSDKEKEMIQTLIALTSKKKPKKIPWKQIFTSLPFWSANSLNFGHAWALFTMVNEMPLYTRKVLNYGLTSSAAMSALPHLTMIPSAIGVGILGDWLIKRKCMTITVNRRVFGFVANAVPVPFLMGASLAGCDRTLVMVFLGVMMFFKGFAYSTCRANPVDLSPNFAGVLMGMMNGMGAFAAILGPPLLPLFTNHTDGSIEQWRHFFILCSCIMIVFSLPFCCFGSGEVQPWNDAVAAEEEPPVAVTRDSTK